MLESEIDGIRARLDGGAQLRPVSGRTHDFRFARVTHGRYTFRVTEGLILGRDLLHVIDDEDLYLPLLLVQFQPELFLNRGVEVGAVVIGSDGDAAIGGRTAAASRTQGIAIPGQVHI